MQTAGATMTRRPSTPAAAVHRVNTERTVKPRAAASGKRRRDRKDDSQPAEVVALASAPGMIFSFAIRSLHRLHCRTFGPQDLSGCSAGVMLPARFRVHYGQTFLLPFQASDLPYGLLCTQTTLSDEAKFHPVLCGICGQVCWAFALELPRTFTLRLSACQHDSMLLEGQLLGSCDGFHAASSP